MYKLSIFFQNINDLPAFKEFLSKQAIPRLLITPNLQKTQVTSIGPSVDFTPNNLLSIQFILELYFDSIEAIYALTESPEGAKLIDLVINNPYSKTGTLFGDERILNPEKIDLSKIENNQKEEK